MAISTMVTPTDGKFAAAVGTTRHRVLGAVMACMPGRLSPMATWEELADGASELTGQRINPARAKSMILTDGGVNKYLGLGVRADEDGAMWDRTTSERVAIMERFWENLHCDDFTPGAY